MTFHSDAHYVYLLKEHTTLILSPEKVHETGLQEVGRGRILCSVSRGKTGFRPSEFSLPS